MEYIDNEFIIKIDFNKESKKPAHIFKIMSDVIESFGILDSALICSIDSKIQPIVMLEDIEKGSILSRFKYFLEQIPDDAIHNLEWKKLIGTFLLKGKYAIIDFINKRETISTNDDINLLIGNITDLAKEAQIKELTIPGSINIPKLLSGIAGISNAIAKIEENENISYRFENKDIVFNLNFKFDEVGIEDLLTSEVLRSTSIMILKIKKPDYLGDSKWEFRHRRDAINANILDGKWIEKFRNREITLKPGDSIRANVETEVKYDFDREVISINHCIVDVVEVIYSKPNNPDNLFKL